MSGGGGFLNSTSKNKLSPGSKTPLAMLKGRPGSLSVPSFSFRFNPKEEDDELEEVTEPLIEVGQDIARERANSSPPSPPPKQHQQSNMSPTFIKSSLMKGKRTFSLDSDSPMEATATTATTSGSSDTWSIFSELKEKIARTVEERFRIDLHTGGSSASSSKSGSSEREKDESTTDKTGDEKVRPPSSVEPERTTETESPARSPPSVIVDGGVRLRRAVALSDSSPVTESRDHVAYHNISDVHVKVALLPEAGGQPGGCSSSSAVSDCRLLSLHRRWTEPLLPFKTFFIVASLLLTYVLLPVPAYLDGLLTGVVVTASAVWTWHHFTRPRTHTFSSPDDIVLTTLPTTPSSKVSCSIRKVWMNEYLGSYSPEDFHIGHTQSVLVRLEGSTLRISYSKNPIPKRSMWNEATPKQVFIHQRHYDMCGAKLSLLPEGLAKRRHWSRRYPICVEIKQFSKPADPISPQHLLKENENLVVLFARSGREKEEWYWRLEAATGKNNYGSADSSASSSATSATSDRGATKLLLNYGVYMARLIPSPVRDTGHPLLPTERTPSANVDSYTPPISPKKDPQPATVVPQSGLADITWNLENRFQNVAWVNAVLGRCFWDFLREAQWADRVRQRIQRKLATIKVPYFIEELRVSDIEMGSQLPQVTSVSSPIVDERGLWVDVGVSYYGALRMTLATKLNLMRLKRMTGSTDTLDGVSETSTPPNSTDPASARYFSSFYDSEADESVESSSDEEGDRDFPLSAEDKSGVDGLGGAATSGPSPAGRRTSRTLLRLVDTIAQSRYFQHATEYKYIKKAMEGVSNTPLVLTVELLTLSGTVAVNIPPPPSDRLWYGFRGNPQLSLVAKPKVGEREVQFTHVVEWIEKKLVLEFQRFLVLPNMDDLIIPIANSGIVQFSTPRDESPPTPTFSHK